MKENIANLFRLELKSRFGNTKLLKPKEHIKRFINIVFLTLLYALFVAAVYFLTKMFVERSGLEYEFLVLASMTTLLFMTIVCTSSVIKNLYFTGDNELLLRFPVSGTEVLISKSIYVFAQHIISCLLILAPIYVTFGIISHANIGYYFACAVVLGLITITPFFIANIIAIPVMLFVNIAKSRFVFVLAMMILLLVGGFIIYMKVLTQVLEYIQNEQITIFSPQVKESLSVFANSVFNPFRWYADLLAGTQGKVGIMQMLRSFLYVVLVTVITCAGAFIITRKYYYKTILNLIETQKASFSKKASLKQRSVFYALFKREFLLIFRSSNYSFQYFAMAVAAPVMVYYCNKLAADFAKATIGQIIVPGLTLSVIILFSTIIVSFASTSISREGNCFYQTKVIPISYSTQVLVKLFLYSIVATASSLVSCVCVYLAFGLKGASVISLFDVGMIFLISEFVILGITCASIRVDIKMPTFNVSGDGEIVAANKNVALAIFLGVVIACVFGLFSMVFSILPLKIGAWQIIKSKNDTYWVLLAASVIIFAVSAGCLFPTIGKEYKKIVP